MTPRPFFNRLRSAALAAMLCPLARGTVAAQSLTPALSSRVEKVVAINIVKTSKQFTAATVALDGKLSLEDDVRRYLPELPDLGSTVTLRHLLAHTSGWRDYIDIMSLAGWDDRDHTTDRDALDALVRQRALNFAPGSDFRYSNTGFFLASLVVKRVTGRSLADGSVPAGRYWAGGRADAHDTRRTRAAIRAALTVGASLSDPRWRGSILAPGRTALAVHLPFPSRRTRWGGPCTNCSATPTCGGR